MNFNLYLKNWRSVLLWLFWLKVSIKSLVETLWNRNKVFLCKQSCRVFFYSQINLNCNTAIGMRKSKSLTLKRCRNNIFLIKCSHIKSNNDFSLIETRLKLNRRLNFSAVKQQRDFFYNFTIFIKHLIP